MERNDNKDLTQDLNSRRAFLLKAGIAGVPLLMSFKSRATWGSSSLNCGLSATASQIASMAAQTGKQCKEYVSDKIRNVDYFGKHTGCFRKAAPKVYKYKSKVIDTETKFKDVFGGSKSTKFESCVKEQANSFERNITYCFLYAFYLEHVLRKTGEFPRPDDFVRAYQQANGQVRADLIRLVAFYVNGY